MYKSPIDVISTGLQTTIENNVYKVVESYGINVDKDELLKALQYDRNQYNHGFADGVKSVTERMKYLDFEIVDGTISFDHHQFSELMYGKTYTTEITF
jgi:hypothetical protein